MFFVNPASLDVANSYCSLSMNFIASTKFPIKTGKVVVDMFVRFAFENCSILIPPNIFFVLSVGSGCNNGLPLLSFCLSRKLNPLWFVTTIAPSSNSGSRSRFILSLISSILVTGVATFPSFKALNISLFSVLTAFLENHFPMYFNSPPASSDNNWFVIGNNAPLSLIL